MASILLGGVSLLGGYLCRKLSHLYQVPHFKDFVSLESHLKNNARARDDVLVEGWVESAQFTKDVGLKDAVILQIVKTKPLEISSTERKVWWDITTEKMGAMRYCKLWDTYGGHILVKYVSKARGLRELMICEIKPLSSSKLKEVYRLPFTTPLAGYGEAVLKQADGPVSFTPIEVGSSIKDLHYPHMKATALKLISVVLFVAGGTMIVFGVISFMKRFFQQEHRREQGGEPRNGARQQPPDDIY